MQLVGDFSLSELTTVGWKITFLSRIPSSYSLSHQNLNFEQGMSYYYLRNTFKRTNSNSVVHVSILLFELLICSITHNNSITT